MAYAHPDVLVSTEWVAEHLNDPDIRILEVDEDVRVYDSGHVPGALKVDWLADLWDNPRREFVSPEQLAELFGCLGVGDDTVIVLYGDRNNWWAAYAFWFFTYSGHTRLKLMDGGRVKWVEEGRPLSVEVRTYPRQRFTPTRREPGLRAFRDEVSQLLGQVDEGSGALVDVRSPAEYSGDTTHMTEYPQEGVLRGGHIPGAENVPWAQAANQDGTFKSFEELRGLYEGKGITADKDVVTYCRIAERSSHTWFVLRYLLGYPNVRNYDGSWTEWGNAVGMPIATGSTP